MKARWIVPNFSATGRLGEVEFVGDNLTDYPYVFKYTQNVTVIHKIRCSEKEFEVLEEYNNSDESENGS